ncbi:MAG: pyruvate synthase subunit beta [Deltaproteobacteria bacterium]|nr:pyruvate synthase subunit beta [Deltaproteobacteria bacterium]
MDTYLDRLGVYAARLVPQKEYLVPGHRACQGCAEVLALRLVAKVLGRNNIIASATGCMEIVSSPLPLTSWDVPWIHVAFENTAAVASGIEAGLKALMRKGRLPKQKITVMGMAGDGGTSDIGVQALSGAMERGHNFVYVCFDNEAYMNTGIQRSSATPFGASTTTSPAGKVVPGQTTWKKNMPEICAAHNIPYVATACPSYPFDLMEKVKKAADIEGPAYIHILSVCPTGWRLAPELAIHAGRLAVETGVFPLYEVERGKYKLSVDLPELRPVEEYLKIQGRFRHLTPELIDKIQQRVQEEYTKLKKKVQMTNEG